MDKFEKLIKNSVENYEAPYTESDWLAMSEKLGPEKGGLGKWAIGGTIAAAAIILGVWYFIPSENSTLDYTVSDKQIESEAKTNKNSDLISEANYNENNQSETTNTIPELAEQAKTFKGVQNAISKEAENANAPKQGNQLSNVSPAQNITPSNALNNIDPIDEKPLIDIGQEDEKTDFTSFNLSAIADRLQVCVNEEVNFSPSIPKLKAIYQWEFEGHEFVSGAYTSKKFDQPGDYQVKLNLLDPKTNVLVNQSKSITIHVKAEPENEIAYEYDNTMMPRVNFKQKNTFASEVNWDIVGIHQTRKKEFSYDFKRKGHYVVNCHIVGENGCESVASTSINIDNNYNLLAPSAFTPNGDNLNETFIPKALLISNTPFIMTIYDKSGQLVFETNEASRPWDGLYTKDLTPAPGGSYVWVVQLTNSDNQTETYQGQVTITR